MTIEECPHCIRKVMFSDTGKCPSCGNSKYVLPNKNKEQIIYDKDSKELRESLDYLSKRIPRLIIGGSVLTVAILIVIIIMAINGTFVIVWYGGIFIGLTIIGKGLKDITYKKELQIKFNQKYKDKMPNR